MNLENIIKKRRVALGLSQTQLAELAGLSKNYVGLLEGGKKSPTINTLKLIAEALKIPLPILTFLSLEDEDIDPKKREGFKLIQGPLNSLIAEYFDDAKSK